MSALPKDGIVKYPLSTEIVTILDVAGRLTPHLYVVAPVHDTVVKEIAADGFLNVVEAVENAVKYCKNLLKFENEYYIERVANTNVTDKLYREFEKALNLKSKPSKQSIEQDIILETIECDNLDDIITKLVDKYSK